MMRSFFYFIGFSFLVSPLHAQTYFKKAIDDPGLTGEKIYLEAITPAGNNRYFIAGYVQTAASEQKGLVMAVDDEANIIWQKQFESDTGFSLTTAALLDDKLYLGGSMNDDGIVIICDTTGNLLQSLKITSTSDQYTSINGMVAINGKMYLNCYGAVDGFHLMRIDGNGVAASLVKYTYEPNFNVKGMVAGEDNMYMYGSLSTSYGEVYGVVAKVDTNGFIKWSKQFHMDNTYELYIHKVVVNADNTLQLFCSVPDNFTGEPNRLLQIRVNANGSEISHQAWEKTSDYFFEVTGAVADGSGYTVCSSASYYDTDTLILQHFNQSMVAEWTMGYGSTDESYTRAIAALPGNATLLTHYRLSTGNGVLHKVGSDGASCDSAPFALLDDDEDLLISSLNDYNPVTANFTISLFSVDVSEALTVTEYCPDAPSGISSTEAAKELSIYPNPSAGFTNLQFDLLNDEYVRIELHSLQSGFISVLKEGSIPAGKRTLPLDLGSIPSGIYLVYVKTESSYTYLKAVVE